MRTLPGLLAFATALPAQFVIVDASGGPGSQYTNLATAAAAVPDGTTLVVRPGTYVGIVTIAGKGLRILAAAGVTLTNAGIIITSTQASQPCLLRSLAIASIPNYSSTPLVVSGCQGRVVIEQCSVTPWSSQWPPLGSGPASSALITGSTQVVLRWCNLPTDTNLSGSNVVAEDCTFSGTAANSAPAGMFSPMLLWFATPAIRLTGGTLQLARCTVQGGPGGPGWLGGCVGPNEPGLTLNGGSAVVRRSGAISGGAYCGTPANAITGSGLVRIDPAVTLTGGLTVSQVPQFVSMPTARGTSAGLGGTITGLAEGTSGDVLLLVLGLPGAPLYLPGFADSFWMQPATHQYAALGVTSPLTAGVAVPMLPALYGFELVWQAVSWNATGFAVSHPSIAFVY